MKLHTRCGVLVIALASLAAGVAGTAVAQPPAAAASNATAPLPGPHHPGPRGAFFGPPGSFLLGSLLRATQQLNLTADQQSQIKSIITTARAQERAQGPEAGLDIAVLGNPADSNYASAVQAAKTVAANRIQLESELQGQIYNVLTAQQKTQLPTVLASIKAQMAARRAQHGAVAPN